MANFKYSDEQVIREAWAVLDHPNDSTYQIAKELGMPQSTLWWHLAVRLRYLDSSLHFRIKQILIQNRKY